MLKISKLADYGVVLLTTMATCHDYQKPHAARDLAETTGLPLPMVSKVLKALAKEGLLEGQRGVNGGYRLAKQAEEITAEEIISALDGPIAITSCLDPELETSACGILASCGLKSFWMLVNDAIKESLGHITLSHLLNPGYRGIFEDKKTVTKSHDG